MNRLPIYNTTSIPHDIESGVEVWKPYIDSSLNHVAIYCHSGKTTSMVRNGVRLIESSTKLLVPIDGNWFDAKWKAHLHGVEMYIKKKDELFEMILEEMNTVDRLKGGEAQ